MFSNAVEAHHETLIILMLFRLFYGHFLKMPSESCFSLRVYKVSRTVSPDVAKRCFTNGFLGLLEEAWGTPARGVGPREGGGGVSLAGRGMLRIGRGEGGGSLEGGFL